MRQTQTPGLVALLKSEQEEITRALETLEDLPRKKARLRAHGLASLLHYLEHVFAAQVDVLLPPLRGQTQRLAKLLLEVEREGNRLAATPVRSALWETRFEDFLGALELYQTSLLVAIENSQAKPFRLPGSRALAKAYFSAQANPCNSKELARSA